MTRFLSFLSMLVILVSPSYANFESKCPQASPVDSPKFCQSFKVAAQCYCTSAGLPKVMCTDVKKIYHRMVAMYGSQDKACRYQKNSSYQTCMDDWNCYLKGGRDSKNHLCSSTGQSCP